MPTTPPSPFTLQKSTAITWLVRDTRYPPDDSRHLVARIDEIDSDEVEVTWLREFPLPLRYATVDGVIEDLLCMESRTSRASRPRPVPHHPPIVRNLRAAG